MKNNRVEGNNLNFKSSSKPIIKIGVIINKKFKSIWDFLKNMQAMKNNKYIKIPPQQIVGFKWNDCGFEQFLSYKISKNL